jgi:hypothetical protein
MCGPGLLIIPLHEKFLSTFEDTQKYCQEQPSNSIQSYVLFLVTILITKNISTVPHITEHQKTTSATAMSR